MNGRAHQHIENPEKDHRAIEHLIASIARLDSRLGREHAENRTDTADFKREVRERLDEMLRAFPNDDPEGHRRFHDALISESEARKAFWSDLRGRLLEKGIWAVVVFLAGAAWYYMKSHP